MKKKQNKDLIVRQGDVFINLNKIELGRVYKNFRDVCECLDLDYDSYKNGGSKTALLKNINQYFEYEKGVEGAYSYQFTKYKSIPLLDMSNMKHKNKVVKLALINNIAKHVKQHPNDYSTTIIFSWDEMLGKLGMVNERYSAYRRKKKELAEHLNVNEFVTEEFYQKSRETLQRAVKAGLNSLQKDGAIIWYDTFRILYKDSEGNKEEMVAVDDDIKLVLEAADLAYEQVYDRMVDKPNGYHEDYYTTDTKKQKAIGYMMSTNRWYAFYDYRCSFFAQLWKEEYDEDITVKNIYKVVKVLENMYRFKKYGDILERHNFDPYIVSPVMQDVLNKNARRRVENIEKNKEVKSIGRDGITYDYSEVDLNRMKGNFETSFWVTVRYCMEDAYKTDEVIKKMNI